MVEKGVRMCLTMRCLTSRQLDFRYGLIIKMILLRFVFQNLNCRTNLRCVQWFRCRHRSQFKIKNQVHLVNLRLLMLGWILSPQTYFCAGELLVNYRYRGIIHTHKTTNQAKLEAVLHTQWTSLLTFLPAWFSSCWPASASWPLTFWICDTNTRPKLGWD